MRERKELPTDCGLWGVFVEMRFGFQPRPHPYQVAQKHFLACFLPFPALLSRGKVVFGGLISNKFIRFDSRVGQVVGQRKEVGDFADKVWSGFERGSASGM